MPADLRRFVDPFTDDPAPVLYCFPSIVGPELQCGGPDLVNRLLEMVETSDVMGQDRYALERAITARTQRLYFDENGRVSLPKELREHSGIEGQVSFSGQGAFFLMERVEDHDALMALVDGLSEDEKAILRARLLPSSMARGE